MENNFNDVDVQDYLDIENLVEDTQLSAEGVCACGSTVCMCSCSACVSEQ